MTTNVWERLMADRDFVRRYERILAEGREIMRQPVVEWNDLPKEKEERA